MYIYIAQPNWLLFLEMLLELVIRVNSTKHSPPLIKQSRCYVIFQIYWLSHLWLSHTFLLHIKDKLRNTQALHHLSFKPSPQAQFSTVQRPANVLPDYLYGIKLASESAFLRFDACISSHSFKPSACHKHFFYAS